MTSGKENETKELLNQMVNLVKTKIEAAISERSLLPRDELFFKTTIEEFNYGEKGPVVSRSSGQYYPKKTWITGSLANIGASVIESGEFKIAVDTLTSIYGKGERTNRQDIWMSLINLVNEMAIYFLPDQTIKTNFVDKRITIFLKEVNDEALNYFVEIKLTGIVILSPEIEIKGYGFHNIYLRQTTAKDIEQDCPAYELMAGTTKPFTLDIFGSAPLPSAILKFECKACQQNEVIEKIKLSLAILRLFRVGGIDSLYFKIYTIQDAEYRSFSSQSSLGSGFDRILYPLGHYQITQNDSDKLKTFWQVMESKIPAGFYKLNSPKLDYLSIAYQRYCDALLLAKSFEVRVTNAVMGLEALFLPKNPEGELNFRLRTHIAKVLGHLIRDDPLEIDEAVKDAYEIRSTYVHGSQISSKTERDLKKEYSNLNAFIERILEHLRVSIITFILCGKKKQEFLRLVDGALVSESKNFELTKCLEAVKVLCA